MRRRHGVVAEFSHPSFPIEESDRRQYRTVRSDYCDFCRRVVGPERLRQHWRDATRIVAEDEVLALFGVTASSFRNGVVNVVVGDMYAGCHDDLSRLTLIVVPPRQNYGVHLEHYGDVVDGSGSVPAGIVMLHGWTLSLDDYRRLVRA
jgi:hypothetical protein